MLNVQNTDHDDEGDGPARYRLDGGGGGACQWAEVMVDPGLHIPTALVNDGTIPHKVQTQLAELLEGQHVGVHLGCTRQARVFSGGTGLCSMGYAY